MRPRIELAGGRKRAGRAATAAGAALEKALDTHHVTAQLLGLAEVRRVSPHVKNLGPGKVPGSFVGVYDSAGGCDRRGTLRGGRSLLVEPLVLTCPAICTPVPRRGSRPMATSG